MIRPADTPSPKPSGQPPVDIYVTLDPKEINTIFQPDQPQSEMPMAAAVITIRDRSLLRLDRVELTIPEWDVSTVLVDRPRVQKQLRRYWYATSDRRPGRCDATMQLVGYRNGEVVVRLHGKIVGGGTGSV